MLNFVDLAICLITLVIALAAGAITGNPFVMIGICIVGGLFAAAPK